jgi:hypothetical protein
MEDLIKRIEKLEMQGRVTGVIIGLLAGYTLFQIFWGN